jgi:hypothetical protein
MCQTEAREEEAEGVMVWAGVAGVDASMGQKVSRVLAWSDSLAIVSGKIGGIFKLKFWQIDRDIQRDDRQKTASKFYWLTKRINVWVFWDL